MASLLALPCESSFQILKLLDIGDKIHLSATCKSYRTQLLSENFSIIRFTSDEASSPSALAAVEGHGRYTKVIEFICQWDHEDSPSPTEPSLPPAACKVLKGLLTLNLHTVRIKFDFNLSDDDIDVFVYFDNEENAGDVRDGEMQDKWRALMNETWKAMLRSSNLSI